MNNQCKKFLRKAFLFGVINAMTVATVIAALGPDGSSRAVSIDYDAVPPLIGDAAEPLVMLVMSNDHELFKKAYTDYTDLDGDGTLDTTYNNSFEYYGYFNSLKCYEYSSGDDAFLPSGDVDDTTEGSEDYKCTGTNASKWSGNFLNWATMTRMDIVRKVLYGGKRDEDTQSTTVLERALIPADIHAFVKVAEDANIDGAVSDYTPYANSVNSISICNVTDYVSGSSDQSRDLDTSSNPPLIKVANGTFPQWSSSEVVQCQFEEEGGATSTSPNRASESLSNGGGSNGEYEVRVSVCVSGEDADADYCREYEDSGGTLAYKPAGLLQEYGEDGSIKFGLLTGSYQNNNEGGVLRKNITDFSGPSAVTADNEVDLETGVFNTLTNGIVTTLDGMRIAGWDYGSNKYTDCNTFSIPISTFKSSINTGQPCRDWGNPLSEIYLEALRYFAGAGSRTATYNAVADSSWLTDMNTASWDATNLITADNACANCSIIVLSTGLNMFDGDDLASASDLPSLSGAGDVSDWTEDVGDSEGITGTGVIVGNADNTSNSNVCTTKTLAAANGGLAGVQGLCPELPSLEGTFEVAGLAYYARRTDLRELIEQNQNIKTYTVALAESLPSFEIEASTGNTISIVPACQANTTGSASLTASGWTYCSLSDISVEEQTDFYSHYLIAWEDSNWGNDYDMDGISSIEVCTATGTQAQVQAECDEYLSDIADDGSNNGSIPDWGAATDGQIQIRASVPQANAGNALRFGFIMNGATGADDGSYIDVLRPGGSTIGRLSGGTTGSVRWDVVRTFTADADTGAILNNPLWYAAKFGSFNDLDGDGTPNNTNGDNREWDLKDTSGVAVTNGDGIPDTFFPVSNPGNLPDSLASIFSRISSGSTSSSAAAVVGNSADGTGAIYQAVYEATKSDSNNNTIEWVGDIISIFIDSQSRFREDKCDPSISTTCNKELDSNDPEIRFRNADIDGDGEADTVLIDRYSVADGSPIEIGATLSSIQRIWDPNESLSALSDTRVINQRAYTSQFDDSAVGGRHILTWIDGLNTGTPDGVVQTDVADNELVAFDTTVFTPLADDLGDDKGTADTSDDVPPEKTVDPRRYLGLDDSTDVVGGIDIGEALVNFIRGQDQSITGWRSRQFFDGTTTVTKRLGDIVNSSPVIVGRPDSDYGVRYNDSEYQFFSTRYRDRRQVLYVGGNDGMLHAFNAGFYDGASRGFDLKKTSEVEHPLGAELWAYIPQALLPHLQWLAEADYPHVYYVDGDIQQFDVNIFDDCTDLDTCTHPYGWGTILVATMRFGGGDITIDPNSDDQTADADGDNITLRSSVVIFDITDPEQPPVLLAELSDAELGYTTSKPALYKKRPINLDGSYDDANAEWKLYIGSGPSGTTGSAKEDALDLAVSDQNAKLFEIDLKTMTMSAAKDTGQTTSFVGDVTTMDWDDDYTDDAVYFGTVGGTPDTAVGALMRYRPGITTVPEVMMNSAQPITAAPKTALDRSSRRWVYAGTGRFFVSADIDSTEQQSFHGIIEEDDLSSLLISAVSKDSLINTTNVEILTTGLIDGAPITLTTGNGGGTLTDMDSFGELQSALPNTSGVNGWYIDFETAGRNLLSPVQLRDVLIFDEYIASGDSCAPAGSSNLVNLNLITGTASPSIVFGTETDPVTGEIEVLSKIDVGAGMIIGINVHKDNIIVSTGGSGGDDDEGGNINLSSQSPDIEEVSSGRRSWLEILLD